VPFLLFDRRYALPGAVDTDKIVSVLNTSWRDGCPLGLSGDEGGERHDADRQQ
jgi:hypothetical protein